jgi:hypothetical protein
VANLEECELLDGFFCRIKKKLVGMRDVLYHPGWVRNGPGKCLAGKKRKESGRWGACRRMINDDLSA